MFAHCLNQGWIEVIVGSMFSGKSEELIRRVMRAKYAKQEVLVFKHSLDDRYRKREVASHSGQYADAVAVSSIKEMEEKAKHSEAKLIAIDEAQFFGNELVNFVENLANLGKRVVVAGLDQDFRGEPFLVMAELLARAEVIDKFNAICQVCGSPSSRTQRLINGRAADMNDPIILVSATELYEARCRKCHQVRGKN